MKIDETLAARTDCEENKTLAKCCLENSDCESKEIWSEIDDESDADGDELNQSFRDGVKRIASDEFRHDLKRIKIDNKVRDLTNTFSFQLDFVLEVDENEPDKEARNNFVGLMKHKSRRGVTGVRDK